MRWLRDFNLKDAIRHSRPDARRVDPDRQLECTVEYAVASFGQVEVLVLVIRINWHFFFAADRENVVLQRNLDILAFESGQLGCDFNLLVRFGHVYAGGQTCRRQRTDGAEATRKLLQQTADLTTERTE